MKITLAYPYDGHAPDETIDVDDATARRLIRDGRARRRAEEPAPPRRRRRRTTNADDTATADVVDPTRVDTPDTPAPGDEPKEADSGR